MPKEENLRRLAVALGGWRWAVAGMAAAPRKIVSLAHIKAKDEPEPPKPRRIAHHGGAVTTNKPVALLQFLHKKKLRGETLSEQE